ncbi:MAG TPA: rhodanese-like domain-containing protein [Acidimicrobiales bacterium]|jgi:rhodanese-related sulfurtransferase|nr:rhodanese-like domain-containing protein [Acidimicrobiales bacterium]
MDSRTVAARLDDVQLVDVRLDNEWDAGHIEGAVHIPEDDLAERVDELDRSRPVVTVCRAGTRSDHAAEWLRGEGFDAHSLDGGLLAWKWAGLPLTGPIVEPQVPEGVINPEFQALQAEFLEVAFAAQKRFGDREPTHAEMQEFLRERLINEGRTPEEADEFLARMGED